MKVVAATLACLLLPLAVGAQSRHLNRPSELDTTRIGQSEVFQAIYHGNFAEVQERTTTRQHFENFFRHSVMAWAWYCKEHVGADAVAIVVTATPVDQWGNAVRTSEIKTYRIPRRFAKKIDEYGGLSFIFGDEFGALIERNGCTSRQTQKYFDNLLRYANRVSPT